MSARRQGDALQALMDPDHAKLPMLDTLVTYDWREKLKLPHAPEETGSMWHCVQKVSLSCWGGAVVHHHSSSTPAAPRLETTIMSRKSSSSRRSQAKSCFEKHFAKPVSLSQAISTSGPTQDRISGQLRIFIFMPGCFRTKDSKTFSSVGSESSTERAFWISNLAWRGRISTDGSGNSHERAQSTPLTTCARPPTRCRSTDEEVSQRPALYCSQPKVEYPTNKRPLCAISCLPTP